ncbi:uncharacterized protein LOC110006851 isoform X2 [Amborella trichopoda]|uniref:uncharacterized protein LOC110006851 isoform X2 n=1 Tax=Amborella trichopoda TaxID=13333 RepID=UPI0009BE9B1A|nr:uncharacterized protein LOC110006851 isoform X2 [Amborella trichopoda]|eukprot:XP_020520156.1 uncharacterized protein LOC110006851 isoform X2 [Amborella trichopoda]
MDRNSHGSCESPPSPSYINGVFLASVPFIIHNNCIFPSIKEKLFAHMSFVSSSLFLSVLNFSLMVFSSLVFFCPNLRRDAGSLILYDFPHIGSNRCFDWAQGPTYNCQSSREASRKSSGACAECTGSSPRCIANVSSKSGPKDLPIIARAAGRLAGRAVGHVQTARGHLQDVLQMSQARQFTHAEAIQAVGAEIVHSSKKLVDLQVKLKF